MTAKEFYDKYIGKAVDIDGAYGVQCVDLFKAFTKDNYGIWKYTTGNNWASGLWYNRKSKPYYQYFIDGDLSSLQNGDWVIWDNGAKDCPDSHVAMYYNGKFLGQNQFGKAGATWRNISLSGALGVLRPKMYINRRIAYRSHLQTDGWQEWKYDGETSGTTGQKKRLEAIQIDFKKEVYAKAHIQKDGWVDYGKITKDTVIGTTGQGKRLECLCLKGDFKYRVHIQGSGWTCWTNADGVCTLGSVGQKLRIEAIEII